MTSFTIEQMAGQRLMVGFDGTVFNDDLKFLIREIKVGGLILFARNIETPDQIRALCDAAQNYALECGQPPLFMAVDQEGGPVARLKPPHFTEFPGNPGIKNDADADRFATVTASELVRVGFNMDMAPVMDMAPENMNSIMVSRSFGGDPEQAARLGCRVIRGLQENGVMAVAKHFPGIGRTVLDSHEDLPVMDAEPDDLRAFDLIPFAAAIRQGVAGVMLSHILYPKLDPEWPASLSARIVRGLLREETGFDGLVITDDLDMGAIARHYDIRTSVARTLEADADIILICHKGPNIGISFEETCRVLRDNPGLRDPAMNRIMRLKQKYIRTGTV